jgi:glycosyltransferase involved in cell wall biosynthesis
MAAARLRLREVNPAAVTCRLPVAERPLHVVLVLDHAHINGGQAKVAIESALGLRGRGHAVTLFAAVGPADPRLPEAGVEVVCLDQNDVHSTRNKLAFAAQVVWNTAAARALRALLAKADHAETIVHVHGWAKALSPCTMHEFFLVCPNGGFYDYPAETICHRRPMSLPCLARNCDSKSYPRKILRLARHAALDHLSGMKEAIRDVILISRLQEEVAGRYFPPSTMFHRVDNPIAVPDLGRKPDGPAGDFLFVGRLSPEKGAAIFAEAARLAGVRPVFVADGPSGDELQARYPEAAFLGWKSPDEVLGLMRSARALVFPSVWYEGQPLTIYEALALGTPAIVSDACAGREAVSDGENGFWFRSGDAAALAARLAQLTDDVLAGWMSEAAYARYWAAPLTMGRHLDALLAIYEGARQEIAADKPASRMAAPMRTAAVPSD